MVILTFSLKGLIFCPILDQSHLFSHLHTTIKKRMSKNVFSCNWNLKFELTFQTKEFTFFLIMFVNHEWCINNLHLCGFRMLNNKRITGVFSSFKPFQAQDSSKNGKKKTKHKWSSWEFSIKQILQKIAFLIYFGSAFDCFP